MTRLIIYTGFNNPQTYKRGVENIIETQAHAAGEQTRKFYLFFDQQHSIFRWNDIVCVGIKKGPARFIRLNLVVKAIYRKARRKGWKVVIHSHNYLMSAFLVYKTRIFTVHDGLWYLKKCFDSRAPWIFWAIERFVYWRVKEIQCNSNFTYANSQLPALGRPSTVIYCTTPVERYALRKALKLVAETSHKWEVLIVRSIEPRARIDLVIEVAKLAQAANLDMSFIVCGKGPLLDQYRSLGRSFGLGNIQFLGFVSDEELVARYRHCDCVLLTCENGEGFGLPIIEGYCFGKPVVASNKCAIPEVICDSIYLSSNNAVDILEKLRAVASMHVREDVYRVYYEKNFSNSVISQQFAELYGKAFSS